ncbi:MAG: divergent PAP2 family protein [Spirochaetota bacterium]
MLIDFLTNKAFWTSAFAFLIAQAIKFGIGYYTGKKSKLTQFFGTGGMPSSHSATVTALAASIGLKEGFSSSSFAVSAIFCAVVLYDATNIRRAAGNNASAINQIVEYLGTNLKETPKKLDTHLGHTYFEVIAGVVLGIWLSLVSHFFL